MPPAPRYNSDTGAAGGSSMPPPPVGFMAASPSVMPRAPAPPPPPPQRHPALPAFTRPLTQPPTSNATAQLEERLGAAQLELRKLGSERHTLRARLRREVDRQQELESALRAEQELRRHAAVAHHAALTALRTRLVELEAEKDLELMQLAAELAELRAALASATARGPGLERPIKPAQGLRRIRGIGPAYQRLLAELHVTRVQQIAAWSPGDVASFAEQLRIRAERILKEDWVGQARALTPDPED